MANNPTLGFRVDPDLYAWLQELRPRAGYQGADAARMMLELLWAACGSDVPSFPFEIAVSVKLRSGAVGKAYVDEDSQGLSVLGTPPWIEERTQAVAEDPIVEDRPPAERAGVPPTERRRARPKA